MTDGREALGEIFPVGQPLGPHLGYPHGEHGRGELELQLLTPKAGAAGTCLTGPVSGQVVLGTGAPVDQRIVDERLEEGQEGLAATAHHSQRVLAGQPEYALLVGGGGVYFFARWNGFGEIEKLLGVIGCFFFLR